MIFSWWVWFDSGYPGVRETLPFVSVFFLRGDIDFKPEAFSSDSLNRVGRRSRLA